MRYNIELWLPSPSAAGSESELDEPSGFSAAARRRVRFLVAAADDHDVVFHSDVSLVRIDAQVVDRDNRAIGSLNVEDFVLLEEGHKQPIKVSSAKICRSMSSCCST